MLHKLSPYCLSILPLHDIPHLPQTRWCTTLMYHVGVFLIMSHCILSVYLSACRDVFNAINATLIPTLSFTLLVLITGMGLLMQKLGVESWQFPCSLWKLSNTVLVSMFIMVSRFMIQMQSNVKLSPCVSGDVIPFRHISKMTQATFKQTSHQIISISSYSKPLIQMLLHFQIFYFFFIQLFLDWEGVMWMSLLATPAPHHLVQVEMTSVPQETGTEEPCSISPGYSASKTGPRQVMKLSTFIDGGALESSLQPAIELSGWQTSTQSPGKYSTCLK